MDFKDFKKVGITKTHTIFEHPEGHVIHVSNSGIPQKLKKEMRDIPVQEMSDGGLTKDAEELQAMPEVDVSERLKALQAQPPVSAPAPVETSELNLQQQPEQLKGPNLGFDESQAPAQQAQPTEAQDPYYQSLQTLEQKQKQLGMEEERIAAQEASASFQAAKQLQDIGAKYELDKKDLREKIDSVNQSILKGEIDPNRYLGGMSTAGKITTAIGLILGGIGAGMTGKENLAFKMLENAIDRDVDAQKQELNKKNNLLTAYYKMYGDLEQAEHATKAQLMSMASLQSHAFAAKSKSVNAQQQNAVLQQQIEAKKIEREDQFAKARTLKEMEARVSQPSSTPATAQEINYMIENKGTSDSQKNKLRESYSDYSQAIESLSILKSLMNDQTKMASWKNMTKPERYQVMQAYRVGLAPGIKAITGETRMSDQEFEKFIEPFVSGAFTTEAALNKRMEILTAASMPKIKAALSNLATVGIKNLPSPQVPVAQPKMTMPRR
jgi:hypothetical protein